jgi:hypothetical protein
MTYEMGIHPFVYNVNDTRIANIYADLLANFARTATPNGIAEIIAQNMWSSKWHRLRNF